MPEKRLPGRFGYETFTPAKTYPPLTVRELAAAFSAAPQETP